MAYSIELDCSPGLPRPDTLLTGVLAGTGLSTEDFEEPRTWFGNWEYYLKDDPHLEDKYEEVRGLIKERIISLYNQGRIRYGSW